MKLSEVIQKINTTKSYYLNLLRRLMLRPLLVDLGREVSVASKSTLLPPTPDARLPSCLITYFFRDLFNTDLVI
jgi:hypothetical protein